MQGAWLQGPVQAPGAPQAAYEEPLAGEAACVLGAGMPPGLLTQ